MRSHREMSGFVLNLLVDPVRPKGRYARGMSAVPLPKNAPERSPVLRVLQVGLHVMFAVLLGLGLVRTFFPAEVAVAVPMHRMLVITLLAAVLALVYVLGTSREYRGSREASTSPRDRSPALVWTWLAVITMLWLTLLFFSPAFVWIAFPLMFLYLYLLRTVSAVLAVVFLWAATWVLPWWDDVRTTGPQPPDIATIIGPGIGAVLAVLIAAAYRYLLSEARHHQRVAEALQAAQTELAATEHRAGQLEERERLAREIHDTLAQGFSSIVLVSRAASQQQLVPETTRRSLELIEETATTNLTEARNLVHHLSAADPIDSLHAQLLQLTKRYETELAVRDQPLEVTLRWEGEKSPEYLPPPISATVLRIVQVGMGNVATHAQATQAVITVGIWDDELTVDIFDNGIGFAVPDTFHPGFTDDSQTNTHNGSTGYGLYGLMLRLTELNGSLKVESAPGEGTVLAASIPLCHIAAQALRQERS